MNKKGGFTLIELLVVIMLLGVMASLIAGNFFTSLKKGRDAKRKGDLEQIQRALETYYEDKTAYPATIAFGSPLTDSVSGKIYMQKIPNDPISGRDYVYVPASDGISYALYTCLENNLQILPYISNGYGSNFSLSNCSNCKAPNGTTDVLCVLGLSSTNVTP